VTLPLRPQVDPHLFQSVVGCIFLGTPFRGTPAHTKLAFAADAVEMMGMGLRSSLVQLLQHDSPALAQLCEQFLLLANQTSMGLVCIFEQQKSNLTQLLSKYLPAKRVSLD
jgi:hypothetical protein